MWNKWEGPEQHWWLHGQAEESGQPRESVGSGYDPAGAERPLTTVWCRNKGQGSPYSISFVSFLWNLQEFKGKVQYVMCSYYNVSYKYFSLLCLSFTLQPLELADSAGAPGFTSSWQHHTDKSSPGQLRLWLPPYCHSSGQQPEGSKYFLVPVWGNWGEDFNLTIAYACCENQ